MSDPVSLRNIPPDALKLAHTLSEQMGLSLNAMFRLSLASGLLVEATKIAPQSDGTFAGWDGLALAKALRRHLSSAIDLLIEYGEHPALSAESQAPNFKSGEKRSGMPLTQRPLESAIEDDLATLGIGWGLSGALEDNG
jgi:hypothetical protein